jgi:hypothetical protein
MGQRKRDLGHKGTKLEYGQSLQRGAGRLAFPGLDRGLGGGRAQWLARRGGATELELKLVLEAAGTRRRRRSRHKGSGWRRGSGAVVAG